MTKRLDPGSVALSFFLTLSLFFITGAGLADSLTIKEAKWESGNAKLVVKGLGPRDARVTISKVGNGTFIGSTRSKDEGDGEWRVRVRRGIKVPPCRVRAEADGQVAERSVKDAGNDCDNGTLPTNDAPVAVDDSATTAEDTAVSIDVLANDSDADGDALSIITATQGSNGSVTISGGQMRYTPATGFTGSDSFGYAITDGNGGSDSAAVMVTVQAGDPPQVIGESINSTSARADFAMSKVPAQDPLNPGGHALLVANDLGMHCADLDYRVFSILPPFNVLHAQVIERGKSTEPKILDGTNVEVVYSAASSDNDPAAGNSTAAERGAAIFKSNFWETLPGDAYPLWYEVYSPLYFGLLKPGDLEQDKGLPVPDSMKLAGNGGANCLATYDGTNPEVPRADCDLAQAQMPGQLVPYNVNDPQHFDRFDHDFNFFNGLLGSLGLGAVVEGTNWFAAEGIPILPVDDLGRNNAYPLMRVQAKDKTTGEVLASTDVVLPVASEADCQQCHARTLDCETINQNYGYAMECNEEALDRPHPEIENYQPPTVASLDSETDVPPGDTLEQQLLNAAKINILRLHDAKWGTTLDSKRRVVCASCHYSPALDLTQLGPTESPNTEQTQHSTMSRAMHGHHGDLTNKEGTTTLFPKMPAPNDPIRDETVAEHLDLYPLASADSQFTVEEYVLQNACYSCHPGKRTQCLRGAMAGGGVVCQDCHGDMLAVGNDFSEGLSAATPFPAGADLSKRVPWAVEPGCQSCHVGDAVNQPADDAGFIYDPDGIRLLRAFRTGDESATPIKAADSRFAESRVVNDHGKPVDLLYRISKGHGGVMCEGCHGSTHAVWPNANPWANDNVTAKQIQGHSGTITECIVCHEDSLGLTLDGPHGMHPVADRHWNKEHEDIAEANGPACKACHGKDGQGTVLSRTAAQRLWECKDEKGTLCSEEEQEITVARGTKVSCTQCHENEINHD